MEALVKEHNRIQNLLPDDPIGVLYNHVEWGLWGAAFLVGGWVGGIASASGGCLGYSIVAGAAMGAAGGAFTYWAGWMDNKYAWSWNGLAQQIGYGAVLGGILGPVARLLPGVGHTFAGMTVWKGINSLAEGNYWTGIVELFGGFILSKAVKHMQKACFTAETKLRTFGGYKPICEFQEGDRLLSRSELDPHGPVEEKVVEEVFVRFARIWHLHVNGQVIRTTSEHPFYARGKGWIEAGRLQVGDWLWTTDRWVPVEDMCDSGVEETVYNLRIADYHTYFVGGEDWGFSVWAHNAECVIAAKGSLEGIIARNGGTKLASHANPNAYQFPSKRAAMQAASEISGNLGIKPTKIPLSTYKEPTLPWSAASGKKIIGKHSQELDRFGKPVAGYHDHFAGHSAFGETQGHINAWGRFGNYKDTIHLYYGK